MLENNKNSLTLFLCEKIVSKLHSSLKIIFFNQCLFFKSVDDGVDGSFTSCTHLAPSPAPTWPPLLQQQQWNPLYPIKGGVCVLCTRKPVNWGHQGGPPSYSTSLNCADVYCTSQKKMWFSWLFLRHLAFSYQSEF